MFEGRDTLQFIYGSLDINSSHTVGAQRDTGSVVLRINCDLGDRGEAANDLRIEEGTMLTFTQP